MSTEKYIYNQINENFTKRYLRVTSVLYPFSGLHNIDSDVVAHAAERGTRVHKICESIVMGFGEFGVDDEVKPYVESFKKWWGAGKQVVMMEKRFFCDEIDISGQVDLIIREDDKLTIIDLKTSYKPSKTWAAQASAYYHLATQAGHDIEAIKFIHLSKTGRTPKIYEYPCSSSFFLAVLMVFKHFFMESEDGKTV